MKLVTFAKAMSPHNVGDTRLVPDGVADDLRRQEMLSKVEPWPADAGKASPEKPKRPILAPQRGGGRRDQREAQ